MEPQLEDVKQKVTYITDSGRYDSLDEIHPKDVTGAQFHIHCPICNTYNNPAYNIPVPPETRIDCSGCSHKIQIGSDKHSYATDISSLIDEMNNKRRVAISGTIASDTYKSRVEYIHSFFYSPSLMVMFNASLFSITGVVAMIKEVFAKIGIVFHLIYILCFMIMLDDSMNTIGDIFLPELKMVNPPSPKQVFQNIELFRNGFSKIDSVKQETAGIQNTNPSQKESELNTALND